MAKRYFALLAIAAAVIALAAAAANLHAQQDGTRFRISVDLVQLNVAVTDNKGNYVTGLKPTDFVITEDGIPRKARHIRRRQRPAPCAWQGAALAAKPTVGDAQNPSRRPQRDSRRSDRRRQRLHPLRHQQLHVSRLRLRARRHLRLRPLPARPPTRSPSTPTAATSSAPPPLTADRSEVVRGVRTTVAGDDAALYNALLLTLKDAATQYRAAKSSSFSPTAPTTPAWSRPKMSPSSPSPPAFRST